MSCSFLLLLWLVLWYDKFVPYGPIIASHNFKKRTISYLKTKKEPIALISACAVLFFSIYLPLLLNSLFLIELISLTPMLTNINNKVNMFNRMKFIVRNISIFLNRSCGNQHANNLPPAKELMLGAMQLFFIDQEIIN